MPKFITEPTRRLPVIAHYDVVVAGGGPAGIGAAVSAARRGAKVLLLEATGCLGGMGTSGLVPCFVPFCHQGDQPMQRGLALETLERLRKADGVGSDRKTLFWIPIDAEKLKLIYDEMAAEAGVSVRFFTQVSNVVCRKGQVQALIVESKSGREAITGNIFIDATGDADIACKAGVPFEKGDGKGNMQSVTLCFTVAGVAVERYWKHFRKRFKVNGNMTKWLQDCQRKGKLPAVEGTEYRIIAHKRLYPDVLGYNFGHVFGVDGTRVEDLTRGMQLGRRLAHNYVAFARKNIAGMENAKLIASGSLLGIRETRRITGRARLTLDDFKASRQFADNIAVVDYPIDVHPSTGRKKDAERTDKQFGSLIQPAGKSYGIPWRSLLPRGFQNLVVVGRSLSADRMVQGSARCMPICLAMGQGAGTAAALATRKNLRLDQLDVKVLQSALIKDGARLS